MVYDPDSRHADGFRADVLSALGRLGMTALRYPGGTFASGCHWRDGVGPRGARPVVRAGRARLRLPPLSFAALAPKVS